MSGNPVNIRKLERVQGEKAFNDILFAPAKTNSGKALVFFGGDIQDYTENMRKHSSSKVYTFWSLENTASILSEKFPKCDIFVVRPSRINQGTWSCYDSFVKSNDHGVPVFEQSLTCLNHLNALLINAMREVHPQKKMNDELLTNIILVGFSKGCVVLNQLLHSLHHFLAVKPECKESIVYRITDMVWLDGGHTGIKNTWITNRDVLNSLSKLNISVHVFVTPYQVCDSKRDFIRKEEFEFSKVLKMLGVKFERHLYYENQERSIQIHFQLLKDFIVNI